MKVPSQLEGDFVPGREALPVFCHEDFLAKLESRQSDPTVKRASLLIQRMLVDARRLHYKSTQGENRGWRRSRLGGGHGSHFYAWWSTKGSVALKTEGSFEEAPEGAIFLRDIRHHDDHSPLPSNRLSDYLPVSVSDSRQEVYAPSPWTGTQSSFLRARGAVRVLKGHPGSGKTTALLSAADLSGGSHVLYLTFSAELAALARDYFDRYCSASRSFTVMTIPVFLRRLIGSDLDLNAGVEARERFRRDVGLYQRSLGPWSSDLNALYDEMFGHLIGAALPEAVARFPKAQNLRLPADAYHRHRDRYIGPGAASYTLDAAQKLDRSNSSVFAETYFPDLVLAWKCAAALNSKEPKISDEFRSFTCIAVDECQDLTPLESYVLIALAKVLNSRGSAPFFLAGDEAQTVRPTDFEWAWLHDLLHHLLATPQEFSLTTNLRSPRKIANLVNRVWDLYQHLSKKDRPSGTGYAEIDDDSPDQVIFCAAAPGDELQAALRDLTQREGVALIAFDQRDLDASLRPLALSPSEAKGLDFQTVCVLNGSKQLSIVGATRHDRGGDIDVLRKRLAIDQLRVALSRPSERLIWIDIAPSESAVTEVKQFLSSGDSDAVAPITLEALRKNLDEEELDVEERLQRCQQDARQLVTVKPDLAWSRAQQAVTLLGVPGQLGAVTDPAVRTAAKMTLVEVCFRLAIRRAKLSPELGHPDLFSEAAFAATSAGRGKLAGIIFAIAACDRFAPSEDRLQTIANAVQMIGQSPEEVEGWLIVEMSTKADIWVAELEAHLAAGDNAVMMVRIIPPFLEAMKAASLNVRRQSLNRRAVDVLLKQKKYAQTLDVLAKNPERQIKIEAQCHEALHDYVKAADLYRQIGNNDKVLDCLRSIPDFDSALKLVREIDGHPARESLEWLAEMSALIAKRPDAFNRVMTAPEKKFLEATLESALGVQRKKAVKKAAATKKPALKKTAVKKVPAAKRAPRSTLF